MKPLIVAYERVHADRFAREKFDIASRTGYTYVWSHEVLRGLARGQTIYLVDARRYYAAMIQIRERLELIAIAHSRDMVLERVELT